MANIGVLYATRHGQTAKIAERIAAAIRAHRHTVEVVRCPRRGEVPFEPTRFDGVTLGSSVHGGRHHREIERFIGAQRRHLDQIPSTFFSVSLSAQGAPPKGPRAARECVDKRSPGPAGARDALRCLRGRCPTRATTGSFAS